ncbi:MAG: helix-turn-helix domain-containing protein [Agathobacter sp.]|nr:helix-turn-helix domain-containing protein [Agathobacter sp.]
MFDTNKVASNIKAARTRMNMTQMNLADEMGVSYQAVSNWERGNSMPDISKLPELCKILNIRFEELVGEKNTETDIAERLMQESGAEVTLEEMAQVGQLVKPDKIESKVNETIEKEGKISFSVLVSLAPFMDKDILGKMAEEIADIDLRKLCTIAPFLAKETLDNIVTRSMQSGNFNMNHIVAIAPFLSKTTIQKIVEYLIAHGQAEKIVTIAPFMGKEMFPSQLKDIKFDSNVKYENDRNSCDIELDDLDEDEVAERAFHALEQGKNVEAYLDYMDVDDVGRLAIKALESDKEIEAFLDYMDVDDVEKLASMALEKGKNIEAYLDYMDDDAIKKLLLKATKK